MRIESHTNLARRKQKIAQRLERKNFADQAAPMLKGGNVHYEMDGRQEGQGYGGLAAIHEMVKRLRLPDLINERLKLLKVHTPYFESDHILNIAYSVLAGGTGLEDIERLRSEEGYLDALGAQRLPDPTTAGDFLRRFTESYILLLLELINEVRVAVWKEKAARDPRFFDEAILEIDASLTETWGECKGGMDISYKGIWGYAPLVVTLANTREVLYIINRSGATPSSKDAAPWIDRAIELVSPHFTKVTVRGDTDYSLTEHMDKWDEKVEFVLGYDAHRNLVDAAEALEPEAWSRLTRPPKYVVRRRKRTRPANVKEEIVRERGFVNQRLLCEDVAAFNYRPTACEKTYRMVVVRKNISVEKGESAFLPLIRYFFYITNQWIPSNEDIVFSANDRCDQENILAQLKSGVHALHAPVDDLTSNGAYMVIASLAWTFKAWYGMVTPDAKASHEIVRMEYKKFLYHFIALPCQIVQGARRLVIRVLGYTRYLETFFATYDAIRRLRVT